MSAKAPTAGPAMPAGPIGGAVAWVGPELARRDDWFVRLDSADVAEIDAAMRHCKAGGAPMQAIRRTSLPLPGLGRKHETLLRESPQGRGVVMARGFPVQRCDLESAAIAYLGMGRRPGCLRNSNGRGGWSVSLSAE